MGSNSVVRIIDLHANFSEYRGIYGREFRSTEPKFERFSEPWQVGTCDESPRNGSGIFA